MQPDTLLHSRYRVIYAVDERPNGQIYRARDEQTGKLTLLGALPQADAEALNDTALLVGQIATIRHDALLPLIDHFSEGFAYYMVCDDPGGHDLDGALRARGGSLPEQEVLSQSRRVLELLEYLHQQKPPLSLSELWPSDVVIAEGSHWCLSPFALARLIGVTPSPYRAPELANPDTEPSPSTDTYAVSALLYQALTGTPPPTAEQRDAGAPLNAPRSLNPALSTLAEQALLRGLQQRAPNRYQNTREMRLALETVQLMAGRSLGLGPDVITAQPAPASPVTKDLAPASPTMITRPMEAPPQPAAGPPPVDVLHAIPAGAASFPAASPTLGRRGIPTGCLVGIALGLMALVLGIAIVIALLLGAGGPLTNWLFGAQRPGSNGPAGDQNASQAVPIGANAITLSNVSEITRTGVIAGEVFGPITFAPDGATLAVGIGDALSLRSVPALEERRRIEQPDGEITAIAWSADGSLLASGTQGASTIRIWNAANGELLRTLDGHDSWIRALAFSPDGTLLASGSADMSIRLWNVADGAEMERMTGHTGWVSNVAFSPDGQQLISSSRDGTVRQWEIDTGRENKSFAFKLGTSPTTNMQFLATGLAVAPDGKLIAVGGTDGIVHVLDASTGEEQRQLRGHEDWVVLRGLLFAPDGKSVISASLDGTIRVWDVAAGVEIGKFEGHKLRVLGISASGDGRQLASTSNEEGRIILWSVPERKQVNSFSMGQGLITGLSYSPEGTALGLTGYAGSLKIHPLSGEGDQVLVGSSSQIQSLILLQNNGIATVSDQGSVMLARVGEPQGTPLQGLDGEPLSLAASRDGRLIAAGSRTGAIVLWDSATGQARQTMRGELATVTTVAISDDGALLAAAGPPAQPQVEVWDVATGRRLQSLVGAREGVIAMAFQPGSSTVAAIDVSGEMLAWDARSGKLIHIVGAAPDEGRFTSLTFSPDGKMIVAGTVTGQLVYWDAATGAVIARLQMAGDAILALAFSPNGEQLAVSARSEDASVYLFELPRQ